MTRKTTKDGEKILYIYIFSMNCSYATATRNERIVNYLEVAERKITFTSGIKSLVSIYLLILKKKKSLYEITLLNDPKKLIDYYISKVDLSN